jgi:hypothetical protein
LHKLVDSFANNNDALFNGVLIDLRMTLRQKDLSEMFYERKQELLILLNTHASLMIIS